MKYPAQGGTPTGRRLNRILIGYFVVAVAVIVLAPFEFTWPPRRDFSLAGPGGPTVADLFLNVLLFVPLGFLADRHGGGGRRVWQLAAAAVLLSLAIELTQLAIPGRWSALSDVVANGLGGLIGAMASQALRRRLGEDSPLAGRLFLDLPLTGFVWLMIPLLWLDALAAGGKLATVAAAAAGSVALAAAVASTRSRGSGGSARLAAMVLGWLVIALGPLAMIAWRTAVVASAASLCAAVLTERRFRTLAVRERRIEPRAVVMSIVLLLPLLMATTMPGLVPGLGSDLLAAQRGILRWLAGVAAFTVLGYLMAEWRGRVPRRWPETATAPMVVAALITPLANAGQGIAGRLLPAILAAGFGSLLFDLQREHVIVLRRRAVRGPESLDVTNLVREG